MGTKRGLIHRQFWAAALIAAVCCLFVSAQAAAGPRRLVIFNWEEYIGSDTLANFKQETGIEVEEVYFEDEEEILGAIVSDPGAFDLVVTSGDYLRELAAARALEALDYSKIPNMKHIGKAYLKRWFDPEQKYSVPYMVGTTGLVINTKHILDNTDSWQVLFDPRHKGHIAMLNNAYEVMAVAQKLLGYSINSKDVNELEQAQGLLLKQKPLVAGYLDVLTIQEMMVSEKLWAAQIYSGEGLSAMDENENLAFVIPKEGAAIWNDCFAMPRGAKNREEAHLFLNYILRPEVNAAIASELWYATPNETAKPLMAAEVLESPEVFPPAAVMSRCEFFNEVGGAGHTHINRCWAELTLGD